MRRGLCSESRLSEGIYILLAPRVQLLIEPTTGHEGESKRFSVSASMVSRLCASYEAVRNLKTEKKIAEVIDKQLATQA
jgi:hypothetical protein